MTTSAIPMLPAGEVAYILRKKLGPAREWSDFLTDCRRGATSYFGLTLLPSARVKKGAGLRPLYSIRDVHAFVQEALARAPTPAIDPGKPVPVVAAIDPSDMRHWRVKQVDLVA